MKRCPAIAPLVAIVLFGGSTYGQEAERKPFEAKMYSIEAISHFGVGDDRFAALTDAQKRNLVEARNDLMAMLQAIQNKGDVTRYATKQTVNKYKSSTALAASLIEAETSILAAGVSDFVLVDKETIKLKFFAVVSSKGEIVVSEKTAVLKETESGWRFSALE